MIELNKQYFRHRRGGGIDYAIPHRITERATIEFTIYYSDGRTAVMTWLQNTFLAEWFLCTELLGALR